jgi:hypothetical protein
LSASLGLQEPWYRPSPEQMATLEREAFIEVGPGHQLYGRSLATVAKCEACDDVLFHVGDETWAIVHLTWTGRTEQPPSPVTQRLGGFLAVEMATDRHYH